LYNNAEAMDLSLWGIPAAAKVVLFVGRLDPQKAPGNLLTAFDQFAVQNSEFHLLFVGDGPLKTELEQNASQLACAKRIHFAGWQSQIPQLMKASSCLVLPSLWEGMPNVVLEAMAAALPVISTVVDGVGELIQDGDQGTLVACDSPTEIQQALLELSTRPEEFQQMAVNAQNIVKKEFTWDSIAQKYELVYENLLLADD